MLVLLLYFCVQQLLLSRVTQQEKWTKKKVYVWWYIDTYSDERRPREEESLNILNLYVYRVTIGNIDETWLFFLLFLMYIYV